MPRLPRVYIEGSLYYITCKSLPNQTIFKDKEDYEMYFGLLKKYKQELGVKIYAYTLLPTHLHLLCEVNKNTSISTLMHNLNSNYTKYFNGRYARKGHLFRERFRAAIIQKDPQTLINLTAHIHLNSERLNLELDAKSYPYGSYKLYLDYVQNNDYGLDIKSQVEEIISVLAGENYANFIERMRAQEEFKKLHKQLQGKKILGSAVFLDRVKKEIQQQKLLNVKYNDKDAQKTEKNITNNVTVVILFVLTISRIYLYFNYSRPDVKVLVKNTKVLEQKKLIELDQTEWQVQLVKANGAAWVNDVMSFKKGKFSSAYLTQLSFPHTNYSVAHQGNAVIWETMQTSEHGTASWHGEIRDGQMNGILSLRQQGQKPQDFSFRSLKYWRR